MIDNPLLHRAIAQTATDLSQQTIEAFESDTFRLIYTIVGTFLTGVIGLGTAAIPFLMRRLEIRAEEGKKARDRIEFLLSINRRDRKTLESLIRHENQKSMDIIEDAIAKVSVLEGNLEKQAAIAGVALEKAYSILHKIRDTEIQIRENRRREGG